MSETIVFFGSGPVAAESLGLLAKAFTVEAVITKPQPAHHRQPFPVLALTKELSLPVFTASNKGELSGLIASHTFRSKLGVIIDHGIIVSQAVINHFPLGIINSHFSLLPRWRGADPISFAIAEGDSETGVSLMKIVAALDEGPLLAQRSLAITSRSTTPSLTSQLIQLSHRLLVETLPLYITDRVAAYPQPLTNPTYSRKLTKADGQIDWTKPAERLEREIRAYAAWPRSRTKLGQTEVVITQGQVASQVGAGEPGKLWLQARQLGVHTSNGLLIIDSLIPVGKKEMSAAAFLAGYRLSA